MAGGITMNTDSNIGIPDITIIIRDMTAILAGIAILTAMITGDIAGTTAGDGVRRREWNSFSPRTPRSGL
jgi:hypothetical protein